MGVPSALSKEKPPPARLSPRLKRLRKKVLMRLTRQGFVHKGGVIQPPTTGKPQLRGLHEKARQDKAARELAVLRKMEPELIGCFAEPGEIDPALISPTVVPIETGSADSFLYRYASLLWSVPVSQGYGRRTRFLVKDQANDKLIGIFAAGDPVFNLRCRDDLIGWNAKDRESRLYNVLDLFVLGAVPPYNRLLGGKLVAFLAASNEVRAILEAKYKGQTTEIRGEVKDSRLALLTTSSALGRSALYDRISYGGTALYERIGATQGYGHFHLNHGLFEDLQSALERNQEGRSRLNKFGNGPNWKMRTAREALELLQLPPNLMRHGIGREVYAIHVAENGYDFLRGDTTKLRKRDLPAEALVQHWKTRWLEGRVDRIEWEKESYRKRIALEVRAGLPIPLGKPRQRKVQTRLATKA